MATPHRSPGLDRVPLTPDEIRWAPALIAADGVGHDGDEDGLTLLGLEQKKQMAHEANLKNQRLRRDRNRQLRPLLLAATVLGLPAVVLAAMASNAGLDESQFLHSRAWVFGLPALVLCGVISRKWTRFRNLLAAHAEDTRAAWEIALGRWKAAAAIPPEERPAAIELAERQLRRRGQVSALKSVVRTVGKGAVHMLVGYGDIADLVDGN